VLRIGAADAAAHWSYVRNSMLRAQAGGMGWRGCGMLVDISHLIAVSSRVLLLFNDIIQQPLRWYNKLPCSLRFQSSQL
jgi:hypothetical protein